jgi:hypothetical protein
VLKESDRDNWNHFKVIQKIPEQHIGKAQNQGTAKNGHTWHCTHPSGSTNVKLQNIFNVQNSIICSTNCNDRMAGIVHTLEAWFVSAI